MRRIAHYSTPQWTTLPRPEPASLHGGVGLGSNDASVAAAASSAAAEPQIVVHKAAFLPSRRKASRDMGRLKQDTCESGSVRAASADTPVKLKTAALEASGLKRSRSKHPRAHDPKLGVLTLFVKNRPPS